MKIFFGISFISMFVLIELLMIGGLLYLWKGYFHHFYHDILDWHQLDDKKEQWSDGLSSHGKCKWCGKDIMQDSQGNWF